MRWLFPLAFSGVLAGSVCYSRAVADPPVVERSVPSFPVDLGVYEYSLRISILGTGTVDGAMVRVGVHEYDGPIFHSSLDDHVSRVAASGSKLYDMSLSFRSNDSIVGSAARILLDDSSVDSVVRLSDDGSIIPVACRMVIGCDGSSNISDMLYDEDASIVRIRRNDRTSVVDIPQEYFSSLVTPSSLIVRIINTPVHRDGERLLLGRFVDPETGSLESIESIVSRVSSGDVSAECIKGYNGSSLLMGSTVTPPSVFGGISSNVGVFYTQSDGLGSFHAPMRGCLSFEIVNGGFLGGIADMASSPYTSFVRFISDEK